jgi:hypothetical protein
MSGLAAAIQNRVNQGEIVSYLFRFSNFEKANDSIFHLTGIARFFPDQASFEALRDGVFNSQEMGDFQTPLKLTQKICYLLAAKGVAPDVIIEPTFGLGNFLWSSLETFPTLKTVYGVEIQEKYEWTFKLGLLTKKLQDEQLAANPDIFLFKDNIFSHKFDSALLKNREILILGNPPWVTNAELGALSLANLPRKSNLKQFKGLDARTGKSNFDVAEYILLRLLAQFHSCKGTLAMLCKNTVIKNLVEQLPDYGFALADIEAYNLNSLEYFGASVDASLLIAKLGAQQPQANCKVYDLENPKKVQRMFGWAGAKFVSNTETYQNNSNLDGLSPLMWRQGIKHDCAKVMELTPNVGGYHNGNTEFVDIEAETVYPLLKSSDLNQFEISQSRKYVIVTQKEIGQETTYLRRQSPKLWSYLSAHGEAFSNRKSSIYNGKPLFSMFGVGAYSFAPYKVAISGLYKRPSFSLILPVNGKPVMLDDTCYFLAFDSLEKALFVCSILNSEIVREFLASIVFLDAKRPYTKYILMRINLAEVTHHLSFGDLQNIWEQNKYQPQITVNETDYEQFRTWLQNPVSENPLTPLQLSLF